MRIVFLIPALRRDVVSRALAELIRRTPPNAFGRRAMAYSWTVDKVWGGTMNLLRHSDVARRAGAEVVIATTDGLDSYGAVFGDERRYRFMPWKARLPTDICVLPDFVSRLADDVTGPVIVYEQSPLHLRADFDFRRPDRHIWTDSPYMLAKCEAVFPGKKIPIVPNVVDAALFPFIPQDQRKPGLLFAYPRKNPEFIAETEQHYAALGGTYWRFELIDGLSIAELAARLREPQAFLASARYEGCALPPQEAMAAGVVVVGRTAQGANFSMQDGVTALNAETPADAARRLRDLESAALRERISVAARAWISRYFTDAEPLEFWQAALPQMNRRAATAVRLVEFAKQLP